jgi:hypothetical protein
MLKLFNLRDVLRIIVVIVAALVVFIIMPFEDDNMNIVLYTSYFFLLLLILSGICWKFFWNKVPFISNWLFPNLSGDWEFTITWQSICNDPESGTVKGSAKIRHTLCYGKKKLVKNCKPHKKQIQGYNNLVDYFSK